MAMSKEGRVVSRWRESKERKRNMSLIFSSMENIRDLENNSSVGTVEAGRVSLYETFVYLLAYPSK